MHHITWKVQKLCRELESSLSLDKKMQLIDTVCQTLQSPDKSQIINELNQDEVQILSIISIICNDKRFEEEYIYRKLLSIIEKYDIEILETDLSSNSIKKYIQLNIERNMAIRQNSLNTIDIKNAKHLLKTHFNEFCTKYQISYTTTTDFIDDAPGAVMVNLRAHQTRQNTNFIDSIIKKIPNEINRYIRQNSVKFHELDTVSIETTFIKTFREKIEDFIVTSEVTKMMQKIDDLFNFQQTLELLITSGIDINIRSDEMPLYVALHTKNNKIAKLLLENGANIFIRNFDRPIDLYNAEYHKPLLPLIILSGLKQIDAENSYIFLDFLIKNKKDILEINSSQFAPIFNEVKLASNLYSLYKLETDFVKKTAIQKANELKVFHNIQNTKGETTLFIAVRDGNISEILKLLSEGANPNILNNKGHSALFYAACRNSHKIIELLIDYGADKEIDNSGCITKRTKKFIKNYNSNNIKPQEYSDQDLQINAMPDFIKKISTTRDSQGNNALHILSIQKDVDVDFYKLFLNLDLNLQNIHGDSPIHIASKYGNIDIVKFLIANNANIHAVNKLKQTPLHFAALYNNPEIVGLLVKNKADINAQDHLKITPLIAAIKKSDLQNTKLLLSLGANPLIKDSTGFNYIDYAIKNTNIEYIKALVNTHIPLCTQIDFKSMESGTISVLLEYALNNSENSIIENKLSHLFIDRNSYNKTKHKVVSILCSILNEQNLKCKEFLQSLEDNKLLAFKISKVVNSIKELSNEQKSEINKLYGMDSLWGQAVGYCVAFFYLIKSLFTDYDHKDSLIIEEINQKIASAEKDFYHKNQEVIRNYEELENIANQMPCAQALNEEISLAGDAF